MKSDILNDQICLIADQFIREWTKATLEKAPDYFYDFRNAPASSTSQWSPKSIIKSIKEYTLLELCVANADYIATTKDLITPVDK